MWAGIRAAIRMPERTSLSGRSAATSRRKSARSGAGPPRLRVASAAARATATAPAAASGWLCETTLWRAAWSATASRSAACQAPSGATRIAAPLPQEPMPSNCAVTTACQDSPAPNRRRTSCIEAP